MVPTRHDDDEMMMIQPNNEATNLLVSSVDDADDSNSTNTTANSLCSRNATKIGALLVICVGLAFTLLYTVTINNTFTEGIGNDNSNDIVISEPYQNILDIDTNAETDTDTDLDDKDLVDSTNPDAIKAALDASNLNQTDKDGFFFLAVSYDKDETLLNLNAENGLYSLSPLSEPEDDKAKAWLASIIDQANEIIEKDPKDEGKSIDAGQVLESLRPKPTCLPKGHVCNIPTYANCCPPFSCIGEAFQLDAYCGSWSADSPFNEVNQLEEINEECTNQVISFVGSVLGIILELFGVPGVGKKAFEKLADKIINRGLPAIQDLIKVVNHPEDSAPTKILAVFRAIYEWFGLGAIIKAVTGEWSVWDYIFNGAALLAKFLAIIVSSGGFLLLLLANFFSAQLEVWNLLNSIIDLVSSCNNADKPPPPPGKCYYPETTIEDPGNRFCDNSTQYLYEIDVCYYNDQSRNYCWSPIPAPPVDRNFREVSPRCGCGEMCLNQVGLYSPRIHYCYQHNEPGRDYYWFNPKKWGDRCENNPYCHMVDSRAYFDCGYENKWGDNDDYFCANDRHRKNSGKCRNPNECCNPMINHFPYYTCDNSKQEIIDGNDAAVTTLPTCPNEPPAPPTPPLCN